MLHCTASRTSSPWHNFVSNTDHWKGDTGGALCENSGGIYSKASDYDFMAPMLANDAKNVFANKKDIILEGSPPPRFISGKDPFFYHT